MTAAFRPGLWRPLGDTPGHILHAVSGTLVGRGVRLRVELGPKNHVGSDYFRLFLDSDSLGSSLEPVCLGLVNRGPFPGFNWVEVSDFRGRLPMEGGEVQIPEGIDLGIVQALARLVPPGGHMMMEYDSAHRALTARSLAAGVPPAATPLGAMMFAVDCGIAFTDWYISEGGREGPRKLQGFRAVDAAHARRRGQEMLAALETFMSSSAEFDWDVQAACRPLAEAAIVALRERLDTPDGPMPPA